ncbi:MAG: hypothetical protein KFH87_06990, partial [Bacteroidetes bacterium]|nr:hypothetical protein [Bacteroidota bacterium]
ELHANYTIECWVKPSSSGGHPSFQTLLCKVGSVSAASYPVWFGLNKSNNRLRFVPNGDAQAFMESSVTIPASTWTHVAARYSGSGNSYVASLFVNGLPAGRSTHSTAGPSTKGVIILAASSTTVDAQITYAYHGIMDEARLWNLARSDAEIADNYRREFSGPLSGLVASWHFDGDVLDASGGNRHGNNQYGDREFYFYRTTDLPAEPTLSLNAPTGGEIWDIGATATIKWQAVGLHHVTVELSRDGGSTWSEILLSAGNAAAGVMNWTVTGPETNQARIRVRTPTETSLEGMSENFVIREPPPVLSIDPSSVVITIRRNMPLPPPVPIAIGNVGGGLLHWSATHGGSGWLSLSPAQSSGNIDTLFLALTTTDIPEGQYSEIVIIDGNASNSGFQIPVVLNVLVKNYYGVSGLLRDTLGAGIEGVTVASEGEQEMNVRSGKDGAYELPDLPEGDYRIAPESYYYSSTPVERQYTPLSNIEPGANFTLRPSPGSLLFHYHEGWNLISIPLIPEDPDVAHYLPDVVMPAYAWDPDSGYVRRFALEPFTAYWVKFLKTDSVLLHGILQRDVRLEFTPDETGWHLCGMPSGPSRVDAILQNPEGMLLSVYEYDMLYGYIEPADGVMMPGRGFFVKIGADGMLIIRGAEEEHTSSARKLLRYPSAMRMKE